MRALPLLLFTFGVAACVAPGGPVAEPDRPGKADGTNDPLAVLSAIPGVSALVEIDVEDRTNCRSFSFTFRQPIDHQDASAGGFDQAIRLVHCGFDAPMVFSPDGYALSSDFSVSEVTELLDGNQLSVEHRYYGSSVPKARDYRFLTEQQSAADHHAIVQAFRSLYPQAWISTGASKGGVTATIHRRYYPDDVDGTVAYVAPFMTASDPRFAAFFDRVGDASCRERLRAFQRRVLSHREGVKRELADSGIAVDRLGADLAVETAATLYSWFFWSYGASSSCASLLGDDATDATMFGELRYSGAIGYTSDKSIEEFLPFSIQSVKQLGYPKRATQGLTDLLRYDGDADVTKRVEGLGLMFDGAMLKDVQDFVATSGSRFIFVYGQNDPWTVGQIELGAAQDSFSFVAQGHNHDAEIGYLSGSDQVKALDRLHAWAGMTPRSVRIPSPSPERARMERAHRADFLPLPRAAVDRL